MSTWIALSIDKITPMLTNYQRETLAARPSQDTPDDVLLSVFSGITGDLRDAIREVGTNILREDDTLLPPELITDAAHLTVEALQGRISGFVISTAQEASSALASSTIERVRSGSLPVSIPSEPQVTPGIRTSVAPLVVSKREGRVSGEALKGL